LRRSRARPLAWPEHIARSGAAPDRRHFQDYCLRAFCASSAFRCFSR
jgi:hypothetical protein